MQGTYLYIANVISEEINGVDYLELMKQPEKYGLAMRNVRDIITGNATPPWLNYSK